MNLQDFCFPVTERPVAVNNGLHSLSDWENDRTFLRNDYKALVREDTNQVISIVRRSYQLVPNQQLIDNLMWELSRIDTPYTIDPSHSFVTNERMRLQVTFPQLTMHDGESDIALSLFLHNSYDLSEGVRMFWGAIRAICVNGMVFGKVLGKFYHRHTNGFAIRDLRRTLTRTYDMIPAIENRIRELDARPVTPELEEKVRKELGKTLAKKVLSPVEVSQWQLYNAITLIVSHAIQQRHRARYQMAAAKVFQL